MTTPTMIVSTARETELSERTSALIAECSTDANQKYVDEYLRSQVETTRRSYKLALEDFSEWMGSESIQESFEVLVDQGRSTSNMIVIRYRSDLIVRGMSPSTVNVRLSAIKSVWKMIKTLGHAGWDIEVKGVESKSYKDTSGPGEEAYREMISTASDSDSRRAARNVCIVRLLHDCGLRRGELVGLNMRDYKEGKILIKGKGRSEKEWVPVPEPTARAMDKWIQVRGDWDGPMFVGGSPSGDLTRNRISPNGVYKIVSKIGRDSGSGSVRPHGLRHTAITTALTRTGGDVTAVSAFSRHRNINTLKIYDDNREDRARSVSESIAPA